MTIPPLSWREGRLTVFYQRQYIDSAQRFEAAMRLSPAHVEALDMFDAIANDPGLHFGMQLQPGAMQFVYNHSQLHDRTGFVDWPEAGKKRHLLRLWLSVAGFYGMPLTRWSGANSYRHPELTQRILIISLGRHTASTTLTTLSAISSHSVMRSARSRRCSVARSAAAAA
jgi:Taurine catabolism dioxygenase TauD, TfdA family